MKKCKLCEIFRAGYAIRKANFFLINFKLVLYGFRIRKTLFCYSKDILNTREQCIGVKVLVNHRLPKMVNPNIARQAKHQFIVHM